MKPLREYMPKLNLSARLPDASALLERFNNRTSLIWLGLFGLSVLLEVLFNLPTALMPFLSFLPQGTLCAATFLGFCCSTCGVKRGLITAAVVLSVFAPLFQPLLAVPAILLFSGGTAYLVARRGYRRPAAAFAVTMALSFIAYLLLAVFVVPFVHAVTVGAWSTLNTVVAAAVASAATTLAVVRHRKRVAAAQAAGTTSSRVRTLLPYAAVAALWLFVPFTLIANRNDATVSLQLRHSMWTEDVDGLPETVQDRMLPRTTAETYMQNLNNEFMTTLDAPHLQNRPDGGLWWQASVHNENRWGRIFGSSKRVLAVDADRTDSHAEETAKSGFIFSDKSWVTRAVFKARHPFSEIADVSYYQNPDKSWSMLLSYTTQKMTWSLPAPTTMVPSFGGVMEMTQNGIVRDWTVAQAAKRFPGAVLYPAALFRQQAEAYGRWHDGWTGSKILQQNVYEVSEDDSNDASLNRLPYVQHFKDFGMQLMIAFEPKGDKQWALTEVLLADAATGKLRKVTPPKGLIGPRQARLNVRSSDTRIDWSHIRKVEPRLVVAPRGVFWLVAIVNHAENEPDRHPYITSVLVDAVKTSECYTFQHAKEMNEFLAQPRPQD